MGTVVKKEWILYDLAAGCGVGDFTWGYLILE